MLHHIADTHVVHHIFSAMPFYHAVEATAAIKPILGDYYRFDSTPIFEALWREAGLVYVSAYFYGALQTCVYFWAYRLAHSGRMQTCEFVSGVLASADT